MMSERELPPLPTGEWVEIVEPSSRKYIFANLTTGEISWTQPPGVKIKRFSDESNQWWELFDQKTKRFYYYNACSQTTVWHRPVKGDIIPLAKLQTLKQNTEVQDDSDVFPTADREMRHAGEPLKRDHRRTASARIPRATVMTPAAQAPPRSRRNQSQRVAKAERSVDPELSRDPFSSDSVRNHPRISDPCNPTWDASGQRGLAEEVGQIDMWLRNFDRVHEASFRNNLQESTIPDSSYVGQNSKPPSAKPGGKIEPVSQSNSASLHHDRLDFPASDARQERLSRMRTGNSSMDSGITADVSCATPSDSSWTTIAANSSPDDPRCGPGAQSNYDPRSSMHRLSLIEEARSPHNNSESISLPIEPQMTPGSQRRAFPRTNPNFVGASFRKTSTGGAVNVDELLVPLNSLSSEMSQKPTLLCLSRQAGNTENKTLQKSDSDDSGDLSMTFRKSEKPRTRQLGSVSKSTECPESATARSSFLYHKVTAADDPWLRSSTSANQMRSNNSTLSASSGESKVRISGSGQNPSVGFPKNSIATNHQVQASNGKNSELGESRRVRHNSEPDYANLQDQAMQRDLDNERSQGASRDFGDRNRNAKCVQAKAEPIYANELLTGRGCLTHEDRFHVPLSQGCHDNSHEGLSSSNSSTSTPSPRMRPRASYIAAETRHMSLRRKKWSDKPGGLESGRSFIDKSRSMHSNLSQQRPLSIINQLGPESDAIVNQVEDTLLQQVTLENFLVENLNQQRKGFLGRAVPISSMLVWTKDPIQKPMIRSENKVVKKEAPELFRLIQTYMGDRKTRDSNSNLALELIQKGWGASELRDEIYVQLCRQMTKNPRDESLVSGWELLGICLSFFPPSTKFQSYLEGHIYRTLDTRDHTESCKLHIYARSSLRRLEKICQTGATRKPSLDEMERCRLSLLEPSMFGNTLQDIMDLQKDRYPIRQLPWIQVTLSEALLNSQGKRILEGIFRVPGDTDEVNALRAKCDHWEVPGPRTDPHVVASVLKLWYRELYEPLIPNEFYDGCVKNCEKPDEAISIVKKLPLINMLVLTYLIRFLQKFASPEYCKITKMDASNLAMVMAPNCLRCQADNPQVLFDNVRKEMSFIRTLIQHLDTSYVDNIK